MTPHKRHIRVALIVIAVIAMIFFVDVIFPGALDDSCQRSEQLC